MKEFIKEIRMNFCEVCEDWKLNNSFDEKKIMEIMQKVQLILEDLTRKVLLIDTHASKAILDLINNVVEGLQYKDDVLLLDTIQYGWLPFLDLVLDN